MKLALGTVQFGLPYGISNGAGQVLHAVAKDILSTAWAAGVDLLDTAAAYGEAEQILGEIMVAPWRIITKIPPLPKDTEDPRAWARSTLKASLARLRCERLDSVLLHRGEDLTEPGGLALWHGLRDLKEAGLCARIGVSIYRPKLLDSLPADCVPDLVQAPFNAFDQTLEQGGWAQRLAERGTAFHLRSVFLQGALLMPPQTRAAAFPDQTASFQLWDRYLEETGQTALAASLAIALSRPWAERIIVGVTTLDELNSILVAASAPYQEPPAALANDDPSLIDPRTWAKT